MTIPRKLIPQARQSGNGLLTTQPLTQKDVQRLPDEVFTPILLHPHVDKRVQRLVVATESGRQMSVDRFRKNLLCLAESLLAECRWRGSRCVQLTLPQKNEWKLNLAIRTKLWLRIQEG